MSIPTVWPKQQIVGLVQFSGSSPPDDAPVISPWYNAGSHAWHVKRAFALPNPILRVPGSLALRHLNRLKDEELKERIYAELQSQLEYMA